jgi:hypothetical protein
VTTDPLARVRAMCLALPGATERISHGEPTFFVRGKVFVMFANNHHGDGRIAVWLPVPDGLQQGIIDAAPRAFFKPPYVGSLRGHAGLGWDRVGPDRRRRACIARRAGLGPDTTEVTVKVHLLDAAGSDVQLLLAPHQLEL